MEHSWVIVVVTSLLLGACSGGGSRPPTATPKPTPRPSASASPTPSASPAFDGRAALLGRWRASGEIDKGGMSWMKEYSFQEDGSFVMTGYPPITVQGRWEVRETVDRRLRIVLTDRTMSGSAWPDEDKWAQLSDDGESLAWDKATYFRQK